MSKMSTDYRRRFPLKTALKASESNKGKAKGIALAAGKIESKNHADFKPTYDALFQEGKVTKRKTNGSFYYLSTL